MKLVKTYISLPKTKLGICVMYLLLSWFYALCSQIIIPLPFNLVPLSLQPLPLLLAAFFLGWHAVNAYGLYLLQGALGLPFFAGLQGGLLRLLGPTGGYLIGFGLAMACIAATNVFSNTGWRKIFKVYAVYAIIFGIGLFQLSWFVPANKLLVAGLYPFIIGDLVIKAGIMILVLRRVGK